MHMKRQSPLCMWKGNHLCTLKGNHLSWSWGVATINAERINIQLSHGKFKRFNLFFLHVGLKTVYITVYNWHREDQQSLHVKRQLPLHVKRWSPLHMKRWSPLCMKRWLPLGVWGIDNQHREDQQSTFTWKIQKISLDFSCTLVLKLFTLLFTIDTERINSICMWKGDYLCMWKGDCLCT